jgi:tetrahydrodipicolinate N-succinyltransferase
MLIKNHKPLAAISYDTQTFGQLRKFIQADEGFDLVRVDPNDFLQNPTDNYQYINLVVKDFDQRKQISAALDQFKLDRFTYIGVDSVASRFRATDITVGQGCMLFPGVWAYTGNIGNDVIMHGLVKLAENVQVGNGCFFSGSITIAGGCTIGDWCFLGNNLFFIDGVQVCDNVKLLPGTNLRKSITQPGTYYNPHTYKIEKIII